MVQIQPRSLNTTLVKLHEIPDMSLMASKGGKAAQIPADVSDEKEYSFVESSL